MNRLENAAALSGVRRRRHGCLGCLGQCIVVLLFGVVLVLAITAVFAPWGFYMGGKFHIIPYRQGWGRLPAPSGDYVLYVGFEIPLAAAGCFPVRIYRARAISAHREANASA